MSKNKVRRKKKAAKMNLNSFFQVNDKKSESNDNSSEISQQKKINLEKFDEKQYKLRKDISVNNVDDTNDMEMNKDHILSFENKNQKELKFNYPYMLLSANYNSATNKTNLKFYDEQTKTIINFDDPTDHKPYFLVKLSDESCWEILKKSPDFSRLKETIVSIVNITIIDRLYLKTVICAKITTLTPSDVPKVRRIFQENDVITFESDIRYHLNYLYDNNLVTGMYYKLKDNKFEQSSPNLMKKSKIPETEQEHEILTHFKTDSRYSKLIDDFLPFFTENIPNVLLTSFDIEINVPKDVFPKARDAIYPISCIALSNSLKENYVFYLDSEGIESIESLRHKNIPENTKIFVFRTEKELLLSFNNFLETIPIIVTYNGNEFDIPYLINRFYRLKIKNSNFVFDKRFKVGKLLNGIHLDLFNWFSNPAIRLYAYSGIYKDLKLGTVSKSILSKEKYEFEGELWNLRGKELIYYNVVDSQITIDLLTNDDNSTFKLILLLARITHVPIDELVARRVSSWLQYFFQFEHRKRGFLIPNSSEIRSLKGSQASSQAIIKDKKFQGAIVIEPDKGIHFDVTVLDFASLYPSIISSRNLSYETILCGHTDCLSNKIPGTNFYVCSIENGIISQLIGFLKDIRVEWFKKLSKSQDIHPNSNFYSIVEKSLKVLINAAYGVLGAEFFSFYCLPVAEATTAVGRHLIEKTIEKCKELHIEVLYGDTDSVFLKTPPTNAPINQVIEWSKKELGIPLEIDKEYRFIALTDRKKNYVGVLKNGDLDVKGLLGKKSNTPKCIKESFNESTKILKEEIISLDDFEKAKEKIKEVIKKLFENLEKSKKLGMNKKGFSVDDLAFSVQLTKFTHQYESNVQHVRAAKIFEQYMKDQGNNDFRLQPGSIIKYIKGKNGVIPIELVKKGYSIDVNSYKSQVDSTFSQILDSLGIDIASLQNKVNLFDFIGG